MLKLDTIWKKIYKHFISNMCLLTEKKMLKNTFWAISNYFKVGYIHIMKIYTDSWEGHQNKIILTSDFLGRATKTR